MKECKIVNLTPHSITIEDVDGNKIIYEPHGTPCRVVERYEIVDLAITEDRPIALKKAIPIAIKGLPPQREGVMYICSGMAADAAWKLGRSDVICPSTDPDDIIRDERGFTTAIRAFKVMPKP